MGRALSMALANIWPQSAPFQAAKYLRYMADHELVIIACGNLPAAVAYWLQEPQAPTVRLQYGLPDPISLLLWRFSDER